MQYINYRESRQRGTVDFPLEYHHVSPSHPQYEMALHWHVEFELIRVLKGVLQITIDERTFHVSAGSFIFIRQVLFIPAPRLAVNMIVWYLT